MAYMKSTTTSPAARRYHGVVSRVKQIVGGLHNKFGGHQPQGSFSVQRNQLQIIEMDDRTASPATPPGDALVPPPTPSINGEELSEAAALAFEYLRLDDAQQEPPKAPTSGPAHRTNDREIPLPPRNDSFIVLPQAWWTTPDHPGSATLRTEPSTVFTMREAWWSGSERTTSTATTGYEMMEMPAHIPVTEPVQLPTPSSRLRSQAAFSDGYRRSKFQEDTQDWASKM